MFNGGGNYNTLIGDVTGGNFEIGDNNTMIGAQAGTNATGSTNTFIGYRAGYNNTGSANTFIGTSAGYNETGSNWLYIDNSNTSSPLIKGDFNADTLEVNGKLGYSTDAGNPDRLAGLDGQQFTSVILGYGLDFTNDTLYVDTTGFGGSGGSGATNLTIEGSGPTYTINSSSGNDVYVTEGAFIALSENAPDTLVIAVDTAGLIGSLQDADFFKIQTTTPPAAITDTMYHTGITGIGEDTYGNMMGQLTIGPDAGTTNAIAIIGYLDSTFPQIAMYPGADPDYGWEIAIEDDNSFFLRQKFGTPNVPLRIEPGAIESQLFLQGDGDVQVSDYPNTRDDGTAANFLGTDANGVIQSYDIDDVISEWYLVGESTPGSEAITDGETVTFNGSGITTVTRTGSTIDINSVEVDGSTTNEAWTIDADAGDTELINNQTVLYDGTGIVTTSYNSATNTLQIGATEGDGSPTNELNTIEEGNVTVQTGNSTIDFQTMFDVAADGAGEVNVSMDHGEASAVTSVETDDWMLMWDAGSTQTQRMLWTDFLGDIITFKESNTGVGTGDAIDFGTGMDVSMSPTTEANISLDFSEFTTDAAPEGDEFVILSDGAGTQEKVAITYFSTGGDTNFAEDNLTWTGNRVHDSGLYTTEISGTVQNWTFLDENGGTGNTLILSSEYGASTGITGGISFQYEDTGTPTEQFDLEANKRSATKSTLMISGEEGTADAEIVYEKNAGLNDNTTESHLAINGGVAYTQNYEWTATAADLTLDRSFYILNVSGSGGSGDEVNLPEVAANGDNWSSAITDAQVQVGQVYVISNFRASTALGIVPFSGDQINGSASTYSLAAGDTVMLQCIRWSGGTGYWVTWKTE